MQSNRKKHPMYSIEHERCIEQHYFSPMIFVCVEKDCPTNGLICHYCIADSAKNYGFGMNLFSSQSNQHLRLSHINHRILPVEEYINTFRSLYFDGQSFPPITNTDFTTPNNNMNQPLPNDWKQQLRTNYKEALTTLQEESKSISEFINEQLHSTEIQVEEWMNCLELSEKDLNHYESCFADSRIVKNDVLHRFIDTSFRFILGRTNAPTGSSNNNIKQRVDPSYTASIPSCMHSIFLPFQPPATTSTSSLHNETTRQTQFPTQMLSFQEAHVPKKKLSVLSQSIITAKAQAHIKLIASTVDFLSQMKEQMQLQMQQRFGFLPFSLIPGISSRGTSLPRASSSYSNSRDRNTVCQRNPSTKLNASSSQQNQMRMHAESEVENDDQSNDEMHWVVQPEKLLGAIDQTHSGKITNLHSKAIWRIVHLYDRVCASCSSDGTIKIWDTRTASVLKVLNSFADAVNDLLYLRDRNLLVSVSGDNKIRVFSLATYKCIRLLSGHINAVYTCHYDTEEKVLLSAGREEEVYGWDLVSGEKLFQKKGVQRSIYSLASIPRRRSFLCGDESGRLSLFEYTCPNIVRSVHAHNKTIYSIKLISFNSNSGSYVPSQFSQTAPFSTSTSSGSITNQYFNIGNTNNNNNSSSSSSSSGSNGGSRMGSTSNILFESISNDMLAVTCSADGFVKIISIRSFEVVCAIRLSSFVYDIQIHMNRIFAQVGKSQHLALISLSSIPTPVAAAATTTTTNGMIIGSLQTTNLLTGGNGSNNNHHHHYHNNGRGGSGEAGARVKIEAGVSVFALAQAQKVRCLQIIKKENLILYETSSSDFSYSVNWEKF